MKRELTCIVCPMGCKLEIELDGNSVINVSGNTCPRGKEYAVSECTAPVRTLTTTVRTSNGDVISVKTDRSVPKSKIFECMAAANSAVADPTAEIGTVILKNIAGTGADLIATQNKNHAAS